MTAAARIAHYRIEEPLGEGGMGEVHAGFDEILERRVAIKLMRTGDRDADARARMLREARAASALNHPGIVTVYEIGEEAGRTYIVMELVEGQTFAQRLSEAGRLPPADAVELCARVADALQVAHDAGILHRDVKAANLMIDRRGHVKVLDFGLSKRVVGPAPATWRPAAAAAAPAVVASGIESAPTEMPDSLTSPIAPTMAAPGEQRGIDPSARTEHASVQPFPSSSGATADPLVTQYGARMGTPGYAALELLRGEEADARSDVFSLGVVLYELVTGVRPFEGRSWSELCGRMEAKQYTPPSAAVMTVDDRFDAVVAKALEPERTKRWSSVRELVDAARAAIGSPASAPTRARPRSIVLPIVAGAGIVAAVGVAFIAGRGRSTSQHANVVAPPDAAPPALPLATVAPDPGRALTDTKACAYSPSFADADDVVYDLTQGDTVDLYTIPPSGGAPRQLTNAPGMEWRSAPGRHPGEVVYIVSDPTKPESNGEMSIAYLDIHTGATEARALTTATAVVARGATYYARLDGGELRRVIDGADSQILAFPSDRPPLAITASTDGKWLGVIASDQRSDAAVCVVSLEGKPTFRCLETSRALNGRPAFSADGHAIYYATETGIRRQLLAVAAKDAKDEMVVPGALGFGGIAVSPDGSRLLYSDCRPRAQLIDVTSSPARVIVDGENPQQPVAGPDGLIAYVRAVPGATVLVVREATGAIREVTSPQLGTPSDPAFDATGKRIAFKISGPNAGIYYVDTAPFAPVQVTTSDHDGAPVWTKDGKIAFTRTEDGQPYVYLADPDGVTPPKKAFARSRMTLSSDPHGGNVLLTVGDVARLYLWNPRTGVEKTLSLAKLGGTHLVHAALSADGKYVLAHAGIFGSDLWKIPIATPADAIKVDYATAKGQTMDSPMMLSDGRVVICPSTWLGELHVLDAPQGERY
jgi:serine/threonine protein kinase/Tol biopolymer transport system component